MATADLSRPDSTSGSPPPRPRVPAADSPLMMLWKFFASLKLTVALLVLLICLVFVGTLAQDKHDIWHVMTQGYFRVWMAWVDLQILPTLLGVFVANDHQVEGGFPFPGGYTIGLLMAINLLAAHSLRYKVIATGNRMTAALTVLALGVAATWFVVVRAMDSAYDASITPQFAELLWNLVRGSFAAFALVVAYLLSLAWGRVRRPEWFALAGLNTVMLAAAAYLFLDPEWRIPDAGMRIVWQLLLASAAGGLLMASAWLLFGKRSGVILLHIGIAMLMGHEFYVAETNVEANMIVYEGQTVDWVYDPHHIELAFLDHSAEGFDHVTVLPVEMLATAGEAPAGSAERVIRHGELPYDVRVLDYFANSSVVPRTSAQGGAEWKSFASKLELESLETGSAMDLPGANIELLDKESGDSLGKYVVATLLDKPVDVKLGPLMRRDIPGYPAVDEQQSVEDAERPVSLALRFKRIYKPYEVTLDKFSFDRFPGTDKAKNYSSDIRLVDKEQGTDITFHVYMNNPLRYEGETFYQSDFDKWTENATVLQVVKNEGWMVPYIGCAVVAVGMLVHFGITLLRFLDRRLRERNDSEQPTYDSFGAWAARPAVWVPTLAALFAAGYLASKFRVEEVVVDQMPIHEFAALPVLDEGRIKPYDTVARNTLQYLCSRQEAAITDDGKQKVSAAQWLLDLLSGRKEGSEAYVFRITNLELLDKLDLPPRRGFFRYSLMEIEKNIEKLHEEVLATKGMNERLFTRYQRDVRKLWSQRMMCVDLANCFASMLVRGQETFIEDFAIAAQRTMQLTGPLSVPPANIEDDWHNLYEADLREHCYVLQRAVGEELQRSPPVLRQVITQFGDQQPGPMRGPLAKLLAAYKAEEPAEFSKAIADMQRILGDYEGQLDDPANSAHVQTLKTVEKLDSDRLQFETWFNSASPFFYCMVIYLFALVLSAGAWLGFPNVLGRSAIAMIVVALVVHTVAIGARMYISDRPPITNLYTTAICIGWVIMIGMLIFESIFKLGIGAFVAAIAGFSTLLIAHNLGLDGDTFTVMQAVLDTQFWLSTHVLTINLGYATTMLAGCVGIVYIVAVHMLDLFDEKQTRKLTSMIYGSLCFAILFSFVGTVLGGLWADDSWGRFWGWDPKENGALMIVLWNAVALHARWGKMVGPRGLSMLVIAGNIITAWSWFGVNQLGIGLHNYGFNENLAFYLGAFFLSQIALLVLGAIPWQELRPRRDATAG